MTVLHIFSGDLWAGAREMARAYRRLYEEGSFATHRG
jgi:hypothetical protein